jgi:pimeloyl-ACP methyl ester carboxylesterase
MPPGGDRAEEQAMITIIRSLAIAVALTACAAAAQSTVQGPWDGAIHVAGQDLPIHVTFTAADKGTIDIQGVTGLALTNVNVTGDAVHFELPAGLGLCIFEGTVKGELISGSFAQGPAKGTFDLARHKDAPPAPPEPPPPYRQEDVRIANGPISLAGTLTVPPTPGRHPAVILITGSGAENRDEEVFGFKVFRLLADQLTRQGIAVLRCDDRGVGGSTGSTPQSTSEDFATDVLADLAFLQSRSDIDGKHIGLIGHSEGGLIAPIAAARSPQVAFIVLLSGPALPGDQILLAQGASLLKIRGLGPDALARQAATQRRLFDAAQRNAAWDELEKQFSADADAQIAKLPEAQRQAAQQAATQQIAQIAVQYKGLQTPWFRFFLTFDPATVLEKVRCPVLAFFGALDFQVPVDVNRPALERALAKGGNRDVTIKVMPKANHLYQEAKTGDVSEYTSLEKQFVPDLVPTLTAWIQQHVKGS